MEQESVCARARGRNISNLHAALLTPAPTAAVGEIKNISWSGLTSVLFEKYPVIIEVKKRISIILMWDL